MSHERSPTCGMGTASDEVPALDSMLRVRGVESLRVCKLLAMPNINEGTTLASAMNCLKAEAATLSQCRPRKPTISAAMRASRCSASILKCQTRPKASEAVVRVARRFDIVPSSEAACSIG